MRLLVPITSKEDVVEFGAISEEIEFYMGLQIPEWTKRFSIAEEFNRMSSFKQSANVNMSEIKEIVKSANGKEVYITLNSSAYSMEQVTFIDEIMGCLSKSGVNGVILGDVMLVEAAKRHGLKAVASTMMGIYNTDIAKFCVENGFDRLILPRDITLSEMYSIVKTVTDVEYECFIMRNGCRYSDSNCLGYHSGKYGAVCTYLDRSKIFYGGKANDDFDSHDKAVLNHHVYAQAFHKSACGMCAVWDMLKMGIAAGKVVGRADGRKSLETDVKELAENIAIAKSCNSRSEYFENMVMPYHYDTICYQGLNCYYPEARYSER